MSSTRTRGDVPQLARLVHAATGDDGAVVVKLSAADLSAVADQRVDASAEHATHKTINPPSGIVNIVFL